MFRSSQSPRHHRAAKIIPRDNGANEKQDRTNPPPATKIFDYCAFGRPARSSPPNSLGAPSRKVRRREAPADRRYERKSPLGDPAAGGGHGRGTGAFITGAASPAPRTGRASGARPAVAARKGRARRLHHLADGLSIPRQAGLADRNAAEPRSALIRAKPVSARQKRSLMERRSRPGREMRPMASTTESRFPSHRKPDFRQNQFIVAKTSPKRCSEHATARASQMAELGRRTAAPRSPKPQRRKRSYFPPWPGQPFQVRRKGDGLFMPPRTTLHREAK